MYRYFKQWKGRIWRCRDQGGDKIVIVEGHKWKSLQNLFGYFLATSHIFFEMTVRLLLFQYNNK